MDISGGFVAATGARGPSLDDGWEEGGEAQIGFVLVVARWVGGVVWWCGYHNGDCSTCKHFKCSYQQADTFYVTFPQIFHTLILGTTGIWKTTKRQKG